SSGSSTALLEALQLGRIRPGHPPLALIMPADLKLSAFAPLMQRRVCYAYDALQVREPPLVLAEGRTATSPRLMHPETLHQLMHRLSAEGCALSWGVESLLRQRLRDARRTIACLGQGLDPLT